MLRRTLTLEALETRVKDGPPVSGAGGEGDLEYPEVGGEAVRALAATIGANVGYDPVRVLVGDVDGDGLADIVCVGDRSVTVWINRSGDGERFRRGGGDAGTGG